MNLTVLDQLNMASSSPDADHTSVRKLSRRQALMALGLGTSGLVLSVSSSTALPFTPARASESGDSTGATFSPNVFVHIDDSAIKLVVHRSEMGQGVRTSMPMLLAEELEVDLDDIELVQAPGDVKYGNQNTDGSTSVRLNWESLRQAGATARGMLVEAAAKEWGVPAGELVAESGAVSHSSSGRKKAYTELAAAAADLPVPENVPLKPAAEFKIIGKPIAGLDVVDMTTGGAQYGADLTLPGMVYATIERCPTIKGTCTACNKEAALAVPGVQQVIELEGSAQPLNTNAGVAVIADSTWNALQGRKALEITWDHGQSPLESGDGMRQQLTNLVEGTGKSIRSEGDFAAAKASAERVIEASYHAPYLVHAPMEPMAATAKFENDTCEIWAPCQDPQTAQRSVAQAIGVSPANVTINVTLLGGAFGRKSKPDFMIEAAKLAQKIPGTPVKLQWTREDEVRHGFYRAENMQKLEATLDADQKVTGWRHHTAFPTIGSTFFPGAVDPLPLELGMGFANMPYQFPNIALEASGIKSDVRIGWLRSVCNTFHAVAVNCFIDELAEAVGKDPVAYRLEMLGEPRKGLKFTERDEPYGLDTGRLANVIKKTAEISNWGDALPDGWGHGFASHFSFLAYFAMAVKASVNDGKAVVHEVDVVADVGTAVNPDSLEAQVEGSVAFGLSMAYYGEITLKDGAVRQGNFNNYPMLRIGDMPKVNVHLIESEEPPSGAGEPALPPLAPALLNALYQVTGTRYRDLPLSRAGLA